VVLTGSEKWECVEQEEKQERVVIESLKASAIYS
jgi:hypothetical protein